MKDERGLVDVETPGLDRAILVDAGNPRYSQTLVRQIVWQDGLVHEELQVFFSLSDALAYAQSARAHRWTAR